MSVRARIIQKSVWPLAITALIACSEPVGLVVEKARAALSTSLVLVGVQATILVDFQVTTPVGFQVTILVDIQAITLVDFQVMVISQAILEMAGLHWTLM